MNRPDPICMAKVLGAALLGVAAGCGPGAFVLQVPRNQAPVVAPDAQTTREDTPVTLDVLGNDTDADGDALAIAGVTQPPHATVTHDGARLTFAPATNWSGVALFSYEVSDANGSTATGTVEVTVTEVNDPPVVVEDEAELAEDTSIDLLVLANDSDVDGDPLSLVSVGQPAHGTTVVTGPVVTYTPSPELNGSDAFLYTVADDRGGTSVGAVAIDVIPVNDPPRITGATLGLGPFYTDSTLTVSTTGWTDAEGAAPGYRVRWRVNGLEVAAETGTSLSGAHFVRGDEVYAEVTPFDGLASGELRLTRSVTIVNSPPVATALRFTPATPTSADEIIAAEYELSDADGDGEGATEIRWYVNGAHLAPLDDMRAVPAAATRGDSWVFTVRPHDGFELGALVTSAAVTIANGPPEVTGVTLSPSAPTTSQNLTLTYTYADADGDGESGTEIRWSRNSVAQPALDGALAVPAAQTTKGESWSATVRPRDGLAFGEPVAATAVTIVNTAPVASNGSNSTTEDVQAMGTVTATDEDGADILTYSLVADALHGDVNLSSINGSYIYTPEPDYFGSDSFTFRAWDGTAHSNTATVSLTVNGTEDPPIASDITYSAFADEPFSDRLAGRDPDTDPVLFSLVADSADGTAVIDGAATGAFTFTPSPGFLGVTTFTFQLTDTKAFSNTATATVRVAGPTRVAAGAAFACGIDAGTQTTWCWGEGSSGQLGQGANAASASRVQEATGATSWSFVAAGARHACAITGDGALWCWGEGTAGQLGGGVSTSRNLPLRVDAQRWARQSGGEAHTCAIRSDRSLWCWGQQAYGRLGNGALTTGIVSTATRVGTFSDWAAVSAGREHTCGVRLDQSLWCWGRNATCQLGLGVSPCATAADVGVPTRVDASNEWQEVFAGPSADHTCALTTDHRLFCWGKNTGGQVGDGLTSERPAPFRVGSESDWNAAALGAAHTCGQRSGGGVYCWGAGPHGELASPTRVSSLAPEQVGADVDWGRELAAGTSHACGLKAAGELWCWGSNLYGQLGIGDFGQRLVPGLSQSTVGWGDRGDRSSTCVVSASHALSCWGGNERGQLGLGDLAPRATPTAVAGTSWEAVAGGWHTCATQTDHTLACWGANSHGQLGIDSAVDQTVPTPEWSGETDWDLNPFSLAVGLEHSCAIKTDSSLYCWGKNDAGQLGDGTTGTDRWRRTREATGGTDWARVEAGRDFTCGLGPGAALYCWGDNTWGQLGLGDNLARNLPTMVAAGPFTSLAVGADHACGVIDGMLRCFGRNHHGQLGLGASSPATCGGEPCSLAPVQVGGDSDWQSVFASSNHATCATKASGALFCWGNNAEGQLGRGNRLDANTPQPVAGGDLDWAWVSMGDTHTCARKLDGTLHCWGSEEWGQFGDGFGFAAVPQRALP